MTPAGAFRDVIRRGIEGLSFPCVHSRSRPRRARVGSSGDCIGQWVDATAKASREQQEALPEARAQQVLDLPPAEPAGEPGQDPSDP